MLCGGCGEENPDRAKFCLECGRPLTAAAPPRESRRTVTVVFADMVGFTSLGERLDQESLRRVMDSFYAEMRAAIELQDGTLAKFIGDAVLAVWGTPEVREDDALRAVRAADAMRRALGGLNEGLEARWGVHVGMRTGVNTGEVVVDPTRPADLLVGDTLNVAARLEQAAADGEVLVGPETYRLVRHDVLLEPVEPLALKGKAKPMPAWRVVDTTPGDRRAAARLQAPLVGREAELAALRAAFEDAIAARGCRMTTVIGSPGLGKTRLVDEFVRSVANTATVLTGRCQATGAGITFQPVAEVLRGAAGIDDDADPEDARLALAELLPDDEPDRDRIIERAAGLLGLAQPASTEETFWGMRRILESLARETPVVLVHDDIHWGQPTFLDLLEHFVEWIRDAPVLIVALARPELREIRPRLAAAGAIALRPLDGEASRALVSGLLGSGDLPEALAARILETTEGNPLFLGETLRMLADEGVLRREGNSWVAGDVADVSVPPTINALLSARIERLGSEERSVVERAAVIGHSFYRGAVAELSPPPVRGGVDEALETLSRKELVRPEDEWWLDEQVFRFHHVLIRDAAYRSLLKEARAELHERFAAWLETKAGELAGEHEEVIAFHLEQAHGYRLELGPLDEAGRALAARAAARLHSAGRRALAREDLPAASNLLRRALVPVAEGSVDRLEVLVDLAEALLSAGDTATAEQIVEELGLGADELGDARLQAWALVFALQLDNLTGAGGVRQTADAAAGAAAALAAAGDRAGEAKAFQVVAQAEALLGQVAAAEAALDRALVAARAADDRRRITAVLSGAPRAALWGPAPIVRASGRCLDVVRILRMTPGNRHVEAAALRSQAVLEAMRGRADAARGILDSCRTTLEELGLTLELHETAVHAGIVELLAGEPVAAEWHLRAARDGFHALGIEGGAAGAAALLARSLLEQGRDDEALEATRFAEEHGGEDIKTTAGWLGVRAELLARRGEHEEAGELARRGVALTEPTDALADKADALMTMALVAAAAGDQAGAGAAAGAARELYAAKDHSVGLARAAQLAAPDVAAAAPEPPPANVAPQPPPMDGESPSARRRARFVEAHHRRDWEALERLYAPDCLLVDTRALGWEIWDRAQVVENNRSALGLDPEYTVDIELLYDDGAMTAEILTFHGETAADGRWDAGMGVVAVGRDVEVYSEIFEADDREGMLARVAELRPLAPTATGGRCPEVVHARFARAYNLRDWETIAALTRDDVVVLDHRQQDPVGLLDTLRAAVDVAPDLVFRVERVIDRTDRAIAFTSVTTSAAGGAELRLGHVVTLDEGGLIAEVELIEDPTDEELARRFLPRRAPVRAAAPEVTRVVTLAERWAAAFDARDWEAAAATLAPEYATDDRRPLGIGLVEGGEAGVAAVRGIAEVSADARWSFVPVAAEGDCGLFECTIEGHGADGGTYRTDLLMLLTTGPAGITRRIVFDLAQREEALALHAQLSGWTQQHGEHVRRYADLWNVATSGRVIEDLYAPDLRFVDHRPVGTLGELDRDAFAEQVRSMTRGLADPEARLELLASEGPLRLARSVVRADVPESGAALPMEVESWYVTELDTDGRVRVSHLFGDEAAARVRYRHEVFCRRFAAAFNARDFGGLRELFDAEFEQRDHRLAGAPPVDREAAVQTLRATVDFTPDIAIDREVLAVDGDRQLWRGTFRGSAPGGGEAAMGVFGASVLREDRVWRSDLFETEAQARAHLEAGAAATGASPALRFAPGVTATPASEAFADWLDALLQGDLDGVERWYGPDFVHEDHRRGMRHTMLGGRDTRTAWGSAVGDGQRLEVEATVLAASAQALHMHLVLRDPARTFEIEQEQVAVLRDGLVGSADVYDVGDPAATARFAELAAAEAEAPDWERLHAISSEGMATMFDPSVSESVLAESFAPGFRFRDRRGMRMMGDLDLAGFREQVGSMIDTARDVRARPRILASRGPVRLVALLLAGSAAATDAWEIEAWNVARIDDRGRTHEMEWFDDERRARERFAELAAGPPDATDDVHTLFARRFVEAFNARDRAGLAALMTEDFRQMDRRPLGAGLIAGRDAFMAMVESAMFERMPDTVAAFRVLASDGPWRVIEILYSGHPDSGGGIAEIGFCSLGLARDGATAWTEIFPDAEAALAALPERVRALAEHEANLAAIARAVAADDADALRGCVTGDYRETDHRTGVSAPPVGAEAMVEMLMSVHGFVDGLRFEARVLAVDGDRRIAHHRFSGRSRESGGDVEIEAWSVASLREGRMARNELFGTAAEAWARFDALVLDGPGEARDLDALAARLAPDFTWTDRRPGARESPRDRAAFVGVLRAAAGSAGTLERAPGAELRRLTLEAPLLAVLRTDVDGLLCEATVFADQDEAEARNWWRHACQVAAFEHAYCRHDLDAVAAELHPEHEYVDRRGTVGSAATDATGFLESVREVFTLAPDIRQHQRLVAVRGDRRVAAMLWNGHMADGGGAMEVEFAGLSTMEGERVRRIELFGSTEEALAALDGGPVDVAFSAMPAAGDRHPVEAFFAAHAAAIAARDFDALAEMISEEYTLVSHQSGKRETRHGRAEGVAARRAAVEVAGLSDVVNAVQLLDARGDRLGVVRATWRGRYHGGPFEVTFVAVVELDADGRLLRDESYDVADLEVARRRLEEIAAASY